MARAISEDLRARVIAAVDGGLSRRAAAARFGVAVASAVRWVREWRETGVVRARRQGGDRRSHRIEAYRDVILAAIENQVDMTLVELAELLREQHGASFSASTIWRFLDRHDVTVKKKQRTPASRSGPTSPRGGTLGSRPSRILIPNIWFSSTKRAPQLRWRDYVAGPNAACGVAPPSRTGIGKRQHSLVRCG